eukprot:4415360-Prymnesium_polylepis.3
MAYGANGAQMANLAPSEECGCAEDMNQASVMMLPHILYQPLLGNRSVGATPTSYVPLVHRLSLGSVAHGIDACWCGACSFF